VTKMSAASHARVSSRSERRTANDNGNSRAPHGQQEGRTERQDPRRPPSPQTSAAGTTHKRTTSGSQRTRGGVEERRTERVQVTTRETLTRTRSPERRPGPSLQPQERAKTSEAGRAYSGDPRPRSTKPETPTCMHIFGSAAI
jgi:gamma-tubulin complex component 2